MRGRPRKPRGPDSLRRRFAIAGAGNRGSTRYVLPASLIAIERIEVVRSRCSGNRRILEGRFFPDDDKGGGVRTFTPVHANGLMTVLCGKPFGNDRA